MFMLVHSTAGIPHSSGWKSVWLNMDGAAVMFFLIMCICFRVVEQDDDVEIECKGWTKAQGANLPLRFKPRVT